jgi:glutathione synthase/RimK-type ligase-like ATP-grasp enzyme
MEVAGNNPPLSRKQPLVAIATCSALPELTPDDSLLRDAIGAQGMRSEAVVWDCATVEWSRFDACVTRSVWDYHLKHQRFVQWAKEIGDRMPLWNPAEMMIWNSSKDYLNTLADRGIPTIPTHWVSRGSDTRLIDVLASRGWEDAVIKPSVDLGAMNLRRVSGRHGIDQVALEALLVNHDVMIQPFLLSVEESGETSLVYVGGELSHVVRKRPKAGDFRVQPSWGGSCQSVAPSAAESRVARQVLDALEASPLYARVDLLSGAGGDPCLIELELVDPNLFLQEHPAAADALAAAIRGLICD